MKKAEKLLYDFTHGAVNWEQALADANAGGKVLEFHKNSITFEYFDDSIAILKIDEQEIFAYKDRTYQFLEIQFDVRSRKSWEIQLKNRNRKRPISRRGNNTIQSTAKIIPFRKPA